MLTKFLELQKSNDTPEKFSKNLPDIQIEDYLLNLQNSAEIAWYT